MLETTTSGAVPETTVPVYPTGQGRYAFDQPDGVVLFPGKGVEVVFAGVRLAGTVQRGDLGDYLLLATGEKCGLCPGMRVIPSPLDRTLIAQTRTAVPDDTGERRVLRWE
jgi:hypothetical protein